MSGIVGTIRPSPDGDGPVFEIVRKDRTDGEVRPCEHGRFKLDERWGTVTCGKCKGRVDPFAALLRFAEWFEALDHRRQMVQEGRITPTPQAVARHRAGGGHGDRGHAGAALVRPRSRHEGTQRPRAPIR